MFAFILTFVILGGQRNADRARVLSRTDCDQFLEALGEEIEGGVSTFRVELTGPKLRRARYS